MLLFSCLTGALGTKGSLNHAQFLQLLSKDSMVLAQKGINAKLLGSSHIRRRVINKKCLLSIDSVVCFEVCCGSVARDATGGVWVGRTLEEMLVDRPLWLDAVHVRGDGHPVELGETHRLVLVCLINA